MTRKDAEELGRRNGAPKGIITSDGSVYKNADPVEISKHCESNKLEMFDLSKEEEPKTIKPKK